MPHKEDNFFEAPMKKLAILLMISFIISTGCASTEQIRAGNRENLMLLSPGMTKAEVLQVMGTETIRVGMEVITNPYRSEMYQAGGHTFELLFYYTDIKKTDVAITDDELTPIVLKDGKVDGWGWTYWNNLVQKYEIRIR